MEILWEFLHSSPWLYYAQLAFTIGMLIHAYRTGAEMFWYFIVFFLQPIGAWVYFFVVFLRGFHFTSGGSTAAFWEKKLSLAELRFRVERMPTVNNRLALAEGLMAKGQHAEAMPLLEAVLATDHIHCQAMHDLALCHLAVNQPREAVAMLDRLMKRDSRWSYYRAWRTLIDAHVACGDQPKALDACRDFVKMVPTLENKCLLAEHLLDSKMHSEAIHVLDHALEEHSFAPLGKRFKNWKWARQASRLLKEAETGGK
jgi:hypothetical protein